MTLSESNRIPAESKSEVQKNIDLPIVKRRYIESRGATRFSRASVDAQ